MSTKKIISISLLALIVIVSGGVYLLKKPKIQAPKNPPIENTQTQNGVEGTGDFNVEVEPSTPPVAEILKPNLDREIVVSDKTLTAKTAKDIVEKLKAVITTAKKNNADYTAWMSIGVYYKTIGDYKGASEAWLYVLNFQKQNFIAMNNLGNLYAQNLKDYSKAEKYYLMSAALQPNNLEVYISLHQLYKNQYKEKIARASVILKQGIEKNSDGIPLMVELARYYKATNDIKSARVYYEQAIAVAIKNKNTDTEKSLREELADLPN